MKIITKICFVLITSLLLIMTSCNSSKLSDEYTRLEKNNIVEEISLKTLEEKIENKDTFAVLCGFPSCPWCQQLMPYFNSVAKECGLSVVYYCNIKDARDNADSVDLAYYEYLYNYANVALDTAKDRINAPTILIIKNGELVDYHLDTVSTHVMNEANVLPEMTENEINELTQILEDLFKKLS